MLKWLDVSMSRNSDASGFTIVELLIVIVVIAILAAISIVAYTGIQNRANDTAVQTDLRNVGQKFMEFQVIAARTPAVNTTDLNPMGLSVSEDSYGNHYTPASSNGYNMAYCVNASTSTFAIVAASKSGNVYVFKDGSVREGVGSLATINTTCSNNAAGTVGVNWLYYNGSWHSSVSG